MKGLMKGWIAFIIGCMFVTIIFRLDIKPDSFVLWSWTIASSVFSIIILLIFSTISGKSVESRRWLLVRKDWIQAGYAQLNPGKKKDGIYEVHFLDTRGLTEKKETMDAMGALFAWRNGIKKAKEQGCKSVEAVTIEHELMNKLGFKKQKAWVSPLQAFAVIYASYCIEHKWRLSYPSLYKKELLIGSLNRQTIRINRRKT